MTISARQQTPRSVGVEAGKPQRLIVRDKPVSIWWSVAARSTTAISSSASVKARHVLCRSEPIAGNRRTPLHYGAWGNDFLPEVR